MKALLITLLLIILSSKVYADHTAGGYLEYKHITGNVYEINYYFLRDCSGIQFNGADLYMENDCGQSCVNLGPMAITQTTSIDYGCGNTCGQSGDNPGFELIKLTSLVTLSQPCNSWKFSVWENARNIVDYAGSGNFYTYCKINNSQTNSSSPTVLGPNILTGCLNTTTESIMNIIVPANNTATFEMSAPLNSIDLNCASESIIFESGLGAQLPFPATGQFSVNATNGSISFTPTAIGTSYFGLLVKNYDNNGNYLGETIVQGMIYVSSCPEPGNVNFGGFSSSNNQMTSFDRGIQGRNCDDILVSSNLGSSITDILFDSGDEITTSVEQISPNLYKIKICVEDSENPPCEDKVYQVDVKVKTDGAGNCIVQGGDDVADSKTYTILRPKAYGCLQNLVVTNINTEDNSGAAIGTAYYRARERIYVGDDFPPGLTTIPPGDVLFDYNVTFEAGVEIVLPSCVGGGNDCVTLTAGSTLLTSPGNCSPACLDPIEICTEEYFLCQQEQIHVLVEGGAPPYTVYANINGELTSVARNQFTQPIILDIHDVVSTYNGNIQYTVTVIDASGTAHVSQPIGLVGTKRFYEHIENNMLPNSEGIPKYLLNSRVRSNLPAVFLDDVNSSPPYYGATWYSLLVIDRWGTEIHYGQKNLENSTTWSFDNGEFYWNGHFDNDFTENCGIVDQYYTARLEAGNCANAGVHVDCLEDVPPANNDECGSFLLERCYSYPVPWLGFTDVYGQPIYYISAGNLGGYTCVEQTPSTISLNNNQETNSTTAQFVSNVNQAQNSYNTDRTIIRRKDPERILKDSESFQINFSPNPFTEKIEIKGDIEKVQEIVLYDAKMQLVKKLDISSGNIDLSNLKPGVYMAWATWFNGATSSYKLVKL